MNIIPKAGALILKQDNGILKTLLLFRGNYQDWTLVKGHIEKEESHSDAAIREVKEETGVTVSIISELPTLEYTLPKGDTARVYMFAGVSKEHERLSVEHTDDQLEWYSIADAIAILTCSRMKEYLSNISNTLSTLSL